MDLEIDHDNLLAEMDSLRLRVAELEDTQVRLASTEQALSCAEERFRLLYENAPLGYQSLDEEGRIVEVNPGWLETFGYSREEKRLSLRAQIGPGLGEAVGDQRRVEQILFNLLNNAIKFTESGGVKLTAELVPDFEPSGERSGQSALLLRVSDTGIGIKPEDLATLSQPFRQMESGLTRSHEGTGLGLAICRRLADLMGGEIHAERVWEKGSTFSLTLPLNPRNQ